MSSEEEQDRCWICLGNDGDAPPMSRPTDSRHLIKVCSCSLSVHKRCLLDWATDIDSRSRFSDNAPTLVEQDDVVHLAIHAEDYAAVVGLRATNGASIYTGRDLQCPQCKRQILLQMKPSSILSLKRLVMTVGQSLASTTATAVIGSSVVASIAASGFSLLASIGYKMWDVLAGTPLLLKMMNVKERSFDTALQNDSLTVKHLLTIAGLPLFVHSIRSDSLIARLISSGYPFLFFNGRFKGPTFFLVFFRLAKYIYTIIFQLTLNRFYYRWLAQTKPCFIADRLSLSELEQMEQENQMRLELESNREDCDSGKPWYRRIWSWLFPYHTAEERTIIEHIRTREFEAIASRNYANLFNKESFFWRFGCSCFWPYLGSIVGKLLSNYTSINSQILPFIETPAEGAYACNLIGMCVVAIVRDVMLLYFAWKEVQQYNNLDVTDSEFSGLKVNCFTRFQLQDGEELPNDIIDTHMRAHSHSADQETVHEQGDAGRRLVLGNQWNNWVLNLPNVEGWAQLLQQA